MNLTTIDFSHTDGGSVAYVPAAGFRVCSHHYSASEGESYFFVGRIAPGLMYLSASSYISLFDNAVVLCGVGFRRVPSWTPNTSCLGLQGVHGSRRLSQAEITTLARNDSTELLRLV